MAGSRHGVSLLSVCPICFDAAGALTDGARAGALVLALAAAVVIGGFVRFGWRLLRAAPLAPAMDRPAPARDESPAP